MKIKEYLKKEKNKLLTEKVPVWFFVLNNLFFALLLFTFPLVVDIIKSFQ